MHRIYLTIIAVLVAVILYLTIDIPANSPRPMAPTEAQPPTVAVLKFVALDSGIGTDYLAETMSLEITQRIATTRAITMVSQGPHESMAHYVLEGTVRRTNGTLSVTAVLIDSQTEAHLWSSTYEQDAADFGSVTDQIVANVVRVLTRRAV